MPANPYYPRSNEGRAEFWENILEKAGANLLALGFSPAAITSIENDAKWGVYIYRHIRTPYEHYFQEVTAYANTISHGIAGTENAPLPPPPVPSTWPTAPLEVITCDFEARREAWVQAVKNAPGYTQSIGETLRIVAPEASFDPITYTAVLTGLFSQTPKTVSGKFRKAYGNADGITLYGRREGTETWIELGRFTATPFTALLPMTGTAPEVWEFQARAFKKDVPFGNMSTISQVVVRG